MAVDNDSAVGKRLLHFTDPAVNPHHAGHFPETVFDVLVSNGGWSGNGGWIGSNKGSSRGSRCALYIFKLKLVCDCNCSGNLEYCWKCRDSKDLMSVEVVCAQQVLCACDRLQ